MSINMLVCDPNNCFMLILSTEIPIRNVLGLRFFVSLVQHIEEVPKPGSPQTLVIAPDT